MANYCLKNFVNDPSPNDRLIYIYNCSGKLVLSIDPYTSTFFHKSKYVYIVTDGKVNYDNVLDFETDIDAEKAVARLNDVKKIFIDRTNDLLSGSIDLVKKIEFYSHTANTHLHLIKNIYDALTGATSPSSANTFATIRDIDLVSGDTKEVKVSSTDIEPKFLAHKLTGSSYVSLEIQNQGSDEVLKINIAGLTPLNIFDSFTSNTLSTFQSHTSDTSIHFTKNSIKLDDLYDVDTGGTIDGYYLRYSAGTWIGAFNTIDLTPYYTSSQTDAKFNTKTDFETHTGATNPHGTSFSDLTSTAHTHIWTDINNKPNTLSGYGIIDAYTTAQTYTKIEADNNFLSANTFDNVIITNGINNNGGITATTFYGNLDWNYIQNEPNFALYSDLTAHTSLTGASNPHQISFNDLTLTSHTHIWSDINNKPTTISGYGITDAYTKTEVNNNFLSANTFDSVINTNGINNTGNITANTFYGNLDWSYIQNEPNFALYSDLTAHTSLTGASNPHQTSFNDLTSTAHTHIKSHIIDFVETDYVHTTGDENISGNKTFNNNVVISGNLYVAGTATTVYSENLSVKDNLILINSGETGSGVTRGEAGIIVDRGYLNKYVFFFDEPTDTFRVGESGDTQSVATRQDNPISNGIAFWNNSSTRFDTSNKLLWNGTQLTIDGSISASTIYANIIGDVDWSSVKNTPTTLSGYGITDAYTTAQTYTKTEVNNNFLSANTFNNVINTNGINNNGGITATTFYGNLDWSYIQNEPNFALYSDLTAHTSLTGVSNPHQTSFNDLTSTAHTHIWSDITNTSHTHDERYYTKSEVTANFYSISGGTIYGNINAGSYSITANTFYGNLDWSYIQNEPNFALYSDLTAHTSLTGASNPHLTSFNDLTNTSHTHDERYYTKSDFEVYSDNSIDGIGKVESPLSVTQNLRTDKIGATYDGCYTLIPVGTKSTTVATQGYTITGWAVYGYNQAETNATISFDVKANGTSIVGSGTKPYLSNETKRTGTPTGWTSTTLNENDTVTFEVSENSDAVYAVILLKLTKTV